MKKKSFLSILTSLIMTASLAAPALADTITLVDDSTDVLTSLNGINIDLGYVKQGTVKTADVALAIERSNDSPTNTNQSKKVYKQSNGVTITGSTSVTELSATGGTIIIGSNWYSQGNKALSSDIDSTITLNAPSGDRDVNTNVVYTAAGISAANTNYSTDTKVNVHYVVDNTAPVLTVPADITAEATSKDGADVEFAATATDANGAVVTYDKPSGSTFPIGTTTVNATATDEAGNTTIKSFKVTVQDTTAPVLPTIDNKEVQATSAAGIPTASVLPFINATATDAVDGEVALIYTGENGAELPDIFPVGTTTVYYTAVDKTGNRAEVKSFDVIVDAYVIEDTTPPELTLPNDITIEATGPDGAVVNFTATAFDAFDNANVDVTCDHQSGSIFPLGTTTVNCSATDKAGNIAKGSFNVTVQDTTPPTLSNVPSDITVVATSSSGSDVNFATLPTATDLVDGNVEVICTPALNSKFPLGDTTVTVTATDKHNNTATATFKVTVRYSWSGILQPVNTNGTSVFKLGSTVPIKFSLTGASAGITDAVVSLKVAQISNGVTGTEAEAISTAASTSGSFFRYDSSARQYIFNLGTKTLTTGTYQLRLDFKDGSTNTVIISLK